jgi:hypothetical protein
MDYANIFSFFCNLTLGRPEKIEANVTLHSFARKKLKPM